MSYKTILIDEDLHTELKIWVAKRKSSIKEEIEKLIKKAFKDSPDPNFFNPGEKIEGETNEH